MNFNEIYRKQMNRKKNNSVHRPIPWTIFRLRAEKLCQRKTELVPEVHRKNRVKHIWYQMMIKQGFEFVMPSEMNECDHRVSFF